MFMYYYYTGILDGSGCAYCENPPGNMTGNRGLKKLA
jgi:hypothetical protein